MQDRFPFYTSQTEVKGANDVELDPHYASSQVRGGFPSRREFPSHKDNNKDRQTVGITNDSHVHRIPSRSDPSTTIRVDKAVKAVPMPPMQSSRSTQTPQPASTLREVLSNRKVNAVWDPCHATDVTVHLALSVHEYLDETLEEFSRLQRLGHFASAKQFFEENLHEHIERPQVLIGYAEMLMEQGDYNALSEIDDAAVNNACDNLSDNDERLLLALYWKLIKMHSAHYKPDRSGVLLTKYDVIDDAIDEFRALVNLDEENITSTEVKILALLYRLYGFVDDSDMLQHLEEEFPSEFHEKLYMDLLREGRIWDLRDLFVAGISASIDITEYWDKSRDFVEDWSKKDTDTSTILALLDFFVSYIVYQLENTPGTNDHIEITIRLSEPLAYSIIEHEPENMKSRPFIRWMLVKAHVVDVKGPHYARSYEKQLHSCSGLVFYSSKSQLPRYIPQRGENPGWKLDDAELVFERPVRVAVKTARELGDYQTEAIALQRLILLLANPAREFEELCHLQNLIQGDICGYSRTLASKYLISNTNDSKQNLAQEISGLFNIPNFSNSIPILDSWMLNMLHYSLEGNGPAAQRALKEAIEDYQALTWERRVEIDKKFPTIFQRVSQREYRSSSFNRYTGERSEIRSVATTDEDYEI
ncbi:hypothetical protein F4806DRAFT_453875 [Annulohypoxylon nitens]|nr:hypothetical protein F4806DRAFT_453875 [Annulohypoxylon nitens]